MFTGLLNINHCSFHGVCRFLLTTGVICWSEKKKAGLRYCCCWLREDHTTGLRFYSFTIMCGRPAIADYSKREREREDQNKNAAIMQTRSDIYNGQRRAALVTRTNTLSPWHAFINTSENDLQSKTLVQLWVIILLFVPFTFHLHSRSQAKVCVHRQRMTEREGEREREINMWAKVNCSAERAGRKQYLVSKENCWDNYDSRCKGTEPSSVQLMWDRELYITNR